MRIETAKPVSTPVAESRETASASNRRTPEDLVSRRGANALLPALELGQELDALVVEELDRGRLLLKIGAALIEADSPGGLAAGQSVRLRVEQLQPQVVLHVTDTEPSIEAQAARLLRTHLPAQSDAGELLDSLQGELTAWFDASHGAAQGAETLAELRARIATIMTSGAPPTAEKLKMLARDGGLFYEAKLFGAAASDNEPLLGIANRDLKGLLLAAFEATEATASSKGLQGALKALLHNLETQQAVNLLGQLDSGAFQLQIPFLTGARLSTAVLAIEPDGHGADGEPRRQKSGYSLLFMLDLEDFGRTRIDAHINSNEVRVVFFVDNERSLQIFRQELFGFRQSLLALGYSNLQLAAKPLTDLPAEKQEKFAALAAGALSSIHLLDMKA
ncbi:MAG TPA: hypothetical protein VHM64_08720 [Candidatus Binatia bacterium]|nr:hypothetical protein [Candidatus Binatia bacterium]